MGRMVAHPEFPPDHFRHVCRRPHLSDESLRLRALAQELRQLGTLLGGQIRRRVTARLALQGPAAVLSPHLEPLADRAPRYAQCLGDPGSPSTPVQAFHPCTERSQTRSRPSCQSWDGASFVVLTLRCMPHRRRGVELCVQRSVQRSMGEPKHLANLAATRRPHPLHRPVQPQLHLVGVPTVSVVVTSAAASAALKPPFVST